MQAANERATYYEASAGQAETWAPLTEDVRADVCVVGGGLTGVSAALELAARGFDVRLLEADRVGSGASGRNGGQINFGFAVDTAELPDAVGIDRAQSLWPLAEEAVGLIDRRVAEYAIDCDLKRGFILAASRPRHMKGLRADHESLVRDFGYAGIELLDARQVAEAVGTGVYAGGLRDQLSGHLHPLKYLRGLAAAAERMGAVLHEHSAAVHIDAESGLVRTAAGQVKADHLVLATNAYLDGLMPPIEARAMPVGTWIVATRVLDEAERGAMLRGDECVCDTNAVLDYFRFSADNRLLFGGGVSYLARDSAGLARSLLRGRLARVFPALKDVELDYAWGGRVSVTRNRLPDLGRIGKRLYYAQGFSGQGVALTGLAGQLIAEAVAGDAGRFDVFAGVRHAAFPGGARLRQPLLALGRLWHRLRDAL